MSVATSSATAPASAASAASAASPAPPARQPAAPRKSTGTAKATKTTSVGAVAQTTRTAKPTQAAKTSEARKAAATAAPAKSERLKLVRDSFTMPKPDFELIDALKQRALKQGREVKKSELLRAGLHVLTAMGDLAFGAAVAAVPRLKTGRPHQKKSK